MEDEVRKRLSRLNLEPAHEAEIVEELAQHLEDVYQRSLRGGATEAEAKSAALQELATDDLLQKEMRRSQTPFKESPVAGGPTNSNMLADLLHDSALCRAPATQESRLHDRCCHRSGVRHRRKHRDFQRCEHCPAAPIAVQRSRATRNGVGRRIPATDTRATLPPLQISSTGVIKIRSSKAWPQSPIRVST